MKERIYLDTSVFGGLYDQEFKEHTIPLFERINAGEFIVLYSSLTQDELENAPEQVKSLVYNLNIDFIELIDVTDEVIDLATSYVRENVVGKTSFADCLHIAQATINRSDVLVSWNFKYIVNIKGISGYNVINVQNGYQQIKIKSPKYFIKDEKD